MRYMFWHLEKKCLLCCSKLVIARRWVTEIVRQRVLGHRADNRECRATELAAMMLWTDELCLWCNLLKLTRFGCCCSTKVKYPYMLYCKKMGKCWDQLHWCLFVQNYAGTNAGTTIIITSMPWAVRLSWLENAYWCPLLSAGDFDP